MTTSRRHHANRKAQLALPGGLTEERARASALGDENVRRQLDAGQLRRVVFVPDRLVNLVVG